MKWNARLAAAIAVAAVAGTAVGCGRSEPPKPTAQPAERAAASEAAPPTASPAPAAAAPAAATPAGPPAAPPTKEYATDIGKLCDVVNLADAAGKKANDRVLLIANWLAANLTTPESRSFLIQIQPLGGERKAEALEAEARRVGLPGCNLAAEWRKPPPQ